MQSLDPSPQIHALGLTGLLVRFSDHLTDAANRAAIAFRAAVEAEAWPGVEETSSSLAATYLRFDPLRLSHQDLTAKLRALLAQADWYAAPAPSGRRLWRIPTVYGGAHGPQLAEAAGLAGQSEAEAVATLSRARMRVLTLGFAPGQPYLGELPEQWNIPRQNSVTPQVPAGALVVAVRQFVLFANPSPTGWRHIGQTAFRCFRAECADPFTLRAGDEVEFCAVTPAEFANLQADSRSNGGASVEPLA
ncbi:allophanate hydrolase subunit 1 [Pseudorhodobacter sp. E13]|uniref:5-oxoprolinase subunit B family protein n=1 Tax=Pseudorhodobacter sp. E13 TaxID=2487931 RepID=UPI000F8D9587|nr:allophanate hydrolase subunit 1 [Pseudorhodobacter sp. E13]RUS59309.1 allophanate hydrolase subunit 1 [Pseudorhodobacter sp. E13]